jgi:hypothetical protein
LEESVANSSKELRENPQFISQTKSIQEKALKLAREEVFAGIQSGAISREEARTKYEEIADINYKSMIANDPKIKGLIAKAETSVQGKYQDSLKSHMKMKGDQIDADRKIGLEAAMDNTGIPMAGMIGKFLSGTAVGKGIAETIESTIPKEFASMELMQSSSKIATLRDGIGKGGDPKEAKKKLDAVRSAAIAMGQPYGIPIAERDAKTDEELKADIQKELGVTKEILGDIKEFEERLSNSNLERDLITAFDNSFGEGLVAIGAMAGDQIARLPMMLVGGGFIAETGNIYYDNIKAIAKEEGIEPIEVINQGMDEKAIALVGGTISTTLEYTGLGKVASIVANGVKSQVKKKVVDMLSATAIEGVTEAGQGFVAQISESVAVGENRIDPVALGKEALAGGTMGLLMFGAGTGATSTFSRSYVLNEQSISRATAKKLIQEGDVDGLEIRNDAFLEDRLADQFMTKEDLVEGSKTLNEVRADMSNNSELSTLEIEKAVKEVDQRSTQIAKKFKISKEQAIANVDVSGGIKTKEKSETKNEKEGSSKAEETITKEAIVPDNTAVENNTTVKDPVTEQGQEGSPGAEVVEDSPEVNTEVDQEAVQEGAAQETTQEESNKESYFKIKEGTKDVYVLDLKKIKEKKPKAYKYLSKYKGIEKEGVQSVRNVIPELYAKMFRLKKASIGNLELISEMEDVLSESKPNQSTSKQEFKKQIKDSGDFSKGQLAVYDKLIDSLNSERMPAYDRKDRSKPNSFGRNFYYFAEGILNSKDPEAFIHEIGHFSFYEILKKEDRIDYLKKVIDSTYGPDAKSLKERIASTSEEVVVEKGGKQLVYDTNVGDNFSEYFAEQFRQWYVGGKVTNPEFNSIFEKVSEYLKVVVEKLRGGKYIDEDIISYFEKISSKKDAKTNKPKSLNRLDQEVVSPMKSNLKPDGKPKKKRKDMSPEEKVEDDIVKTTKSLKTIIEEATGVKKAKQETTPVTNKQLTADKEATARTAAKAASDYIKENQKELLEEVKAKTKDPNSKITAKEASTINRLIGIVTGVTKGNKAEAIKRIDKIFNGKEQTIKQRIDAKEKAPTKAQTTADMARADVKTSREARDWVLNNQKTIEDLLIGALKDTKGKVKQLGVRRIKMITGALIKAPVSSLQYKKQVTKLLDMISLANLENYKTSAHKKRAEIKKRKNNLRGYEEPVARILNINPMDVPVNLQKEYNQLLSTLAAKGIPDNPTLFKINEIADFMEGQSVKNAFVKEEVANVMADQMLKAKKKGSKLNDEALIEETMDGLKIEEEGDRLVYRNYLKDYLKEFKKAATERVNSSRTELKEGKTETLTISKEEADLDIEEVLARANNLDLSLFEDKEIAKRVQDFKRAVMDDFFDFKRNDVANVLKIIEGLEMGMVPYRFNGFHSKIRARRNFNDLKASVSSFAEIPKMLDVQKAIASDSKMRSKDKLIKRMASAHIQNIEFMLGKVKDHKVYTTLISPISRKDSQNTRENEVMSKKLASMFEEGLGGISNKKNIEASILMNMVMTQREFALNEENAEVYSVDDHMAALMVSAESIDTKNKYADVLKKYSTDNKFDIQKAEAELRNTPLNTKKTIDGVRVENADDILTWMRQTLDDEVRSKARHVKNYIEDQSFSSREGYFAQKAFGSRKVSLQDVIKEENNSGIAIKSGNLEARNREAGPIVFNAYSNFENAFRSINTHYHLSKPLAETSATLNLMKRAGDEQTKQIASALAETLKTTVALSLNGDARASSNGVKIANQILKKVFARQTLQTLSSIFKTSGELVANLVNMFKLDNAGEILTKGVVESRGDKKTGHISAFMERQGAVQANRTGRASEIQVGQNSLNKKRIQSRGKNSKKLDGYAAVFEGQTVNALTSFIESINKKVVSAGDAVLIEPIWWTSFKNDFESKTGKKITPKMMSDPNFEIEYNREIQESIGIAEKKTSLVVNTGSPFESSIKDKEWRSNSLLRFGIFLKGFSTNEKYIISDALASIFTKDSGTMTAKEATKTISAQIASQAAYSMLRYYIADQAIRVLANSLDLEEPKEKETRELVGRILSDILITNSIGHWRTPWTLLLIYSASQLSKAIEEEYDVEGISDYLFEPSLTHTPSTLKSFGGAAGVAINDMTKLYANLPSTFKNISKGKMSASDADTVIPFLRLSSGLPLARDVQSVLNLFKEEESSGKGIDLSGI